MRRAWQLPVCRAVDRLCRSSAGSMGATSAGSMCWGRSVKRTEGGWACGTAMVVVGQGARAGVVDTERHSQLSVTR